MPPGLGGGVPPAGPAPPDGGLDGAADGDDEELGEEDVDVVRTVVVVADPDPPVEASATPATPAPSPAAIAPVMMSRRMRPSVLETIRASLPSRRLALAWATAVS